jgi:hypothetical protein
VRAVAGLLLELEAWEQRTPLADRPPVPDESWATLELRCGEQAARVVELHRELGLHRRLARVYELLRGLEVAP